jgi:hypothetical protein
MPASIYFGNTRTTKHSKMTDSDWLVLKIYTCWTTELLSSPAYRIIDDLRTSFSWKVVHNTCGVSSTCELWEVSSDGGDHAGVQCDGSQTDGRPGKLSSWWNSTKEFKTTTTTRDQLRVQ